MGYFVVHREKTEKKKVERDLDGDRDRARDEWLRRIRKRRQNKQTQMCFVDFLFCLACLLVCYDLCFEARQINGNIPRNLLAHGRSLENQIHQMIAWCSVDTIDCVALSLCLSLFCSEMSHHKQRKKKQSRIEWKMIRFHNFPSAQREKTHTNIIYCLFAFVYRSFLSLRFQKTLNGR